jgi:hypothetical protein
MPNGDAIKNVLATPLVLSKPMLPLLRAISSVQMARGAGIAALFSLPKDKSGVVISRQQGGTRVVQLCTAEHCKKKVSKADLLTT